MLAEYIIMDIINSELFSGADGRDEDESGRSSRVGLIILVALVLIALAILWLAILH